MGIMIVALCATALVTTMPVATMSRVRAKSQNQALSLAQKEMEAIRSVGYANVTPAQLFANGLIDSTTPISGNTYSFTNVDNAILDNPSAALPGGVGRVTIEEVAIDLKRVTIEVQWTDKGRARTVSLGTLVANL